MAEHTEKTENKELTAALAADVTALSRREYTAEGVPEVRFATAQEAARGGYPTYKAMANSWNKELMTAVWQDIAGSCGGADVIISPAAGVCNNPYSDCATEDPCIAEALVNSFADGVISAGLTPCITCGQSAADADYMCGAVSKRALNGFYMYPFTGVADGAAFMLPYTAESAPYLELVNEFINKNCKNAPVIYKDVPDNLLEKCFEGGCLVYGGSAAAAMAVAEKKERLVQLAAKRTVNFAASVVKKHTGPLNTADASRENTALKIAEQSCVLIKNDGVLPIRAGDSTAILGGLSEEVNGETLCAAIKKSGKSETAFSQGYSCTDDIDEALTEEGIKIARNARYTFVFLGFNGRAGEKSRARRRIKLPASQIALIDRLACGGAKVIALVGADYPVDLSFDYKVSAIIVCPSTGRFTAQALWNIITGKVSPSGRLAQTWYKQADDTFRLLKNECLSGSRKVGSFAGYREYSGGGVKQPYPFGYGLSYSTFEYSELAVQGNEITFKVKNTGRRDAAEVVQVYIGKADSAIIRPAKELKAFLRVNVKAGETVVCKVTCTKRTFEIFKGGKYIAEDGRYSVYIGSSSTDIKLKGTIKVNGVKMAPEGGKSYLYDTSRTNLPQAGFTFGTAYMYGVRGKKAFLGGLTLLIFVLLAVIALAVLQLSGYINFAYMDWWAKFGIICVISVTAAGLLFTFAGGIAIMVSKNKKTKAAASGSRDKVSKNPYERLFTELYGPDDYDEYDDYEPALPERKPQEKAEVPVVPKEKGKEEYGGKYNPDITFEDYHRQLSAFLESRGISAGLNGARRTLAALSASRIVIYGGSARLAGSFVSALSQYFTSKSFAVDLSAVAGAEQLLKDGQFTSAVKHAADNADDVVILALHGITSENASLLQPLAACAYANETKYITAGSGAVAVPANLWFIVTPAADALTLDNYELCRVSAVLMTEIISCEEKAENTYHLLNFYQFRRMTEKLIAYDDEYKYTLDEQCWVKIDRTEKYLNGACGYCLDNRDSLSIERYAAVYLACGGEQNDALDNAVAVKLVLPAAAALKKAGANIKGFAEVIENNYAETDDIKRVLNHLR